MGGVFLYNQSEALLEQSDLDIKQITKGRGEYICDNSQGLKLLIPFRGSKERAAFLREVLQYLQEEGIVAEQVCLTKEGEASVEDEYGKRYWLKDMISGTECRTGMENDMQQAVALLARIHRKLAICPLMVPAFMKTDRNEPGNICQRHYRELIKVKNYVHGKKSKNQFERYFWDQYTHYIEQAKKAIQLLSEMKEKPDSLLCHGDFNQHNIVRGPDGFCIINYESMSCNLQIADLANFLRKILEKNHWNPEIGMRLIDIYARERTISREERQMLSVILLFPEKFWKISNHYINSHKAWVSERDIEKIRQMIELEPARSIFLEKLFQNN